MTLTPTELLAPYKAPLIEHGRALLRAAGTDGMAFEIPGTAVPCMIVIGAEDRVGELLRTPMREPMLGGRRAGDPPAPELTFDEPEPGIVGLTAAQLSVAARHMCNRSADACGVDREDNWKVYGQTFIDELREALEVGMAAGKGGAA